MTNIQKPRGTRDILPKDQPYWDEVRNAIELKSRNFNFDRIDLPTFESTKLFERSIGDETDIISKELFQVKKFSKIDDGDEKGMDYALRPEGTAGTVRAYLENGMDSLPKPVKLWYIGSMFRYDRPQKGRFREFQSMGAELFGDSSPASDALMIFYGWQIFKTLGIDNELVVDINSIGDKNCRPQIKKFIQKNFSQYQKELCSDCKRRLVKNPLRLLDCKIENCQKIQNKIPPIIDILDEDCRDHFKRVLEYLDELEVPYDLNPKLVRGLDYYTRTTFEYRLKNDTNRQNVLGGGGRYDYLIEQIGGKPTSAIGFALGLDRVIDLLIQTNPEIEKQKKNPEFCIVQLGEKARQSAIMLIKKIIENNFDIVLAPGKESLKSQLRLANKSKCKYALIIGQREAFDKSVIVKNLEESSQETMSLKKFDNFLKKLSVF